MSRLFIVFCIYLFSSNLLAQGSLCGTYDVLSTHPDEIRTQLVIKCMRVGDTLFIDGPIDFELIFEIDTFASTPIKKLYLNSTGGKVENSIELAEFIRKNEIETILRKGARCLSACTLLFQAGVTRTAHPDSTFMYHSARFPYQSKEIVQKVELCQSEPNPDCLEFIDEKTLALQETTDQLFELYTLYGTSPEFYSIYLRRPHAEDWIKKGNYLKTNDWYMTAKESLNYSIVNNLTDSFELIFLY